MDRWVKASPGLLVLAMLNSLIMLYTGHSLNSRAVPVTRRPSALFAICMALGAAVSARFRVNRLNPIDRVAIAVFVFCIFYQAVVPSFEAIAGPVALAVLFLAWAYDPIHRRYDRPGSGLSASDM
jgi:hypothetical protein